MTILILLAAIAAATAAASAAAACATGVGGVALAWIGGGLCGAAAGLVVALARAAPLAQPAGDEPALGVA